MTEFQSFEMETIQSLWEYDVEFNLSESGVHPISTRTLLDGDEAAINALLDRVLAYPQTNGFRFLRECICPLYRTATVDNILVTVGAAEANYITARTMLQPGDEAAVMLPNYMQVWGIAQNHEVQTHPFYLREAGDHWALDLDSLHNALTARTKLIAVCNPNNPTGHILTTGEMDSIIQAADSVGAWILADEVYSGTERLTDQQTPSFWGRYDRVIAVNSLSKAYGLPGLRTGWLVAPEQIVQEIWRRHEYTAITTTMLANHLAAVALSSQTRPHLLRRTREHVRRGYEILQQWIDEHQETFSLIPPQAAAVGFARYHLSINSVELIERLRVEKSVLMIPGDYFGMDRFVRIGFGAEPDYFVAALERVHELIVKVQQEGK